MALTLGAVLAQQMDEPARRLMAFIPVWVPLYAGAARLTIDQVYAMPVRKALEGIAATVKRMQQLPEATMKATLQELGAGLSHLSSQLSATSANG